MPRFFFDIQGDLAVVDRNGLDCTDLDNAVHEATFAVEMRIADRIDTWDGEPWQMEIRNERGNIVSVLKIMGS